MTNRNDFKLNRGKTIHFIYKDAANNLNKVETEVVRNTDSDNGLDIELSSENEDFRFTIKGEIVGDLLIATIDDHDGYTIEMQCLSNEHDNENKRMIFGNFKRVETATGNTDNGGYGGGNNGD